MKNILLENWIILSLLLIKAITDSVAIDVNEGSAVTIQCPLNFQYPKWTGPEGLADPLTDGKNVVEPGFEWVDNKDLKITKAMLKHDGNYTCSDGNGNNRTIEVDVQYFSMSSSITTATATNGTAVVRCWCHSNPRCKIVPHVFTHVTIGQDQYQNSTTTFEQCYPNPLMENRTRCGVVAVVYVSKEDNGKTMSCTFEYKDSKSYATLFPKVKVTFPPTVVNITTEHDDKSKLTFNCSTDSSNPVSSLTWRRGSRGSEAWQNGIIQSGYNSYTMDAEYHGYNITSAIDIERESIRAREELYCCARHINKEMCDSIALDSYKISGASVFTTPVALLLVSGAVFVIM